MARSKNINNHPVSKETQRLLDVFKSFEVLTKSNSGGGFWGSVNTSEEMIDKLDLKLLAKEFPSITIATDFPLDEEDEFILEWGFNFWMETDPSLKKD